MSTILWSQLGGPKKPGTVNVESVGKVAVTQANIDRSKEADGDPEFELVEENIGAEPRRFALGLMH